MSVPSAQLEEIANYKTGFSWLGRLLTDMKEEKLMFGITGSAKVVTFPTETTEVNNWKLRNEIRHESGIIRYNSNDIILKKYCN